MRQLNRRHISGILSMVLGCALFAGLFLYRGEPASAQDENACRLLFLSSYSYAWDTVQLQIEGIKAGVPDGTTVDYEFMDTKRVDDDTALELFYEGLAYRLSKVEPYQAIIVGDDAALRFAMQHEDDLFAGIPIIFEGVNDFDLARAAELDPQVTGFVEKLSVHDNIDLALQLFPKATKVVAIFDDTLTSEGERKNFYAAAEDYPTLEFSEINSSRMLTSTLKKTFSELDENTILIFISMANDGNGRLYTSKEAIEMITKFAPVPLFRMVEGGLGWGILGGNIVSMQKSGTMAAELAMDIAKGKKQVENVPVCWESPNIYIFDEQVMAQFGIKKSQLPEDSEYVNHVPGFFERNREVLIPCIIFGIMLAALAGWMCYDNIRKRILTAELQEARGHLENASQHDFLTGLPNRSKFMADLESFMGKSVPCTVIMLDIDNFKHINDTYGHTAGDEALQQVGERLKALHTDLLTAYRYAGDEFIVIVRSDVHKIVDTAANQCLQIFQRPFKISGMSYTIHGSVGAATYPKDAKDGDELIVLADAAMYSVKKNGKNAYALYNGQPIVDH